MFELTESMLQKDDQQFGELLNRMQTAARCTEDDMAILKLRVISPDDPSYPADALRVFKENADVKKHNDEHTAKMKTQVFHV